MSIDFRFISKMPVMALICGSILLLILGGIMKDASPEAASLFLQWFPVLLILGVILQLLWLLPRYRRLIR